MNRVAPVAAMPMYDWPELRSASDQFWDLLAAVLRANGIQTPAGLERSRAADAILRDPGLVLSQTCGYPLVKSYAAIVRVVATPVYRVEGCHGSSYSSAIVVRQTDARTLLSDYCGAHVAINASDSQSGMAALRAAIADMSGADLVFARVSKTGAHRLSMQAVAAGRADIASIDAVCWGLARRYCPDIARCLRVLAWSPSAPALPFVTRARGIDVTVLRHSLAECLADPRCAALKQELLLDSVVPADIGDYGAILEMERAADRKGVQKLAVS